jgi:hypothetical protein
VFLRLVDIITEEELRTFQTSRAPRKLLADG